MKIFFLLVVFVSSLTTSCDRNTLQGLNVKLNAEIKSDYENKENSAQTEYNTEVKPSNPQAPVNNNSNTESLPDSLKNQAVQQVNNIKENITENIKTQTEPDPDEPIAFKPIAECSKSGITAKTNEVFYGNNPQVKSIDSKDEKQIKAWKEIYAKIEASCQSN